MAQPGGQVRYKPVDCNRVPQGATTGNEREGAAGASKFASQYLSAERNLHHPFLQLVLALRQLLD